MIHPIDEFPPTTWHEVLASLKAEEPGTILRLPKEWLPHPEDAGARRSIGLPFGQRSDYRWRLADCSGLHVRDFGSHYEAHIDQVDPQCDLVGHALKDIPGAHVAGGAAVGALAGLVLGRSKEATMVGAGVGALLAAIFGGDKAENPEPTW